MIGFIFGLTLRQLLGKRASLICLGLALLPPLVAIVFRLSDPDLDAERWAARTLMVGLLVTAVLPLIALFLGTSVLGDELEDGTAVYLLTKPMPRWQILVPKLAAAALATLVLVLVSTIAAGYIALSGQAQMSLVRGFGLALVAGSFAYCALFVLMSLVTSRALIAGLVYVFVWEATMPEMFAGLRYFSVRHYVLGLADWLSRVAPQKFQADVSGPLALGLILVVSLIATLAAIRSLEQAEVREST